MVNLYNFNDLLIFQCYGFNVFYIDQRGKTSFLQNFRSEYNVNIKSCFLLLLSIDKKI